MQCKIGYLLAVLYGNKDTCDFYRKRLLRKATVLFCRNKPRNDARCVNMWYVNDRVLLHSPHFSGTLQEEKHCRSQRQTRNARLTPHRCEMIGLYRMLLILHVSQGPPEEVSPRGR